jgi:hypothetical protein
MSLSVEKVGRAVASGGDEWKKERGLICAARAEKFTTSAVTAREARARR